MRRAALITLFLVLALTAVPGCAGLAATTASPAPTVPHQSRWGIYSLDLASEQVALLFSTDDPLVDLDLDAAGTTLAFSRRVGGTADKDEEIYTLDLASGAAARLTDNQWLDTYPVWSPDGASLAFLTMRGGTLDIYLVDRDGGDERLLYDSGGHDADIDWFGTTIAFTAQSRVWLMRDDGTGARPVTGPPRAGEWGSANLPFGDYDPRLTPDGKAIVFERLVDDASPHGNYDFFLVNADGSGETRLTTTGYSQGLASWSHAGDRLVFIVAAIGQLGAYHLYTVDRDGSGYRSITPGYFPAGFLCRGAVFSADDSTIYFIGEWWQ